MKNQRRFAPTKTGRLAPEWVAAFLRNQWPESAEYAPPGGGAEVGCHPMTLSKLTPAITYMFACTIPVCRGSGGRGIDFPLFFPGPI